jgi:hypothetical protein
MVTWQFSPRPGNSHQRRREAIRFLRPLLSSARLVQLFGQIGMLAVTQPEAMKTVEVLIDGLQQRRRAVSAGQSAEPPTRQRA